MFNTVELRQVVKAYRRGLITPLELYHKCVDGQVRANMPPDFFRWAEFALRMCSRGPSQD